MNSVSSVTIQQTSYLQIKPHLLPQQQLLDDSSIKLRADSNESTCTVDVPTVKQYFHKCRSTVSPHVYTDVSFYICLSAYLHITISWKKKKRKGGVLLSSSCLPSVSSCVSRYICGSCSWNAHVHGTRCGSYSKLPSSMCSIMTTRQVQRWAASSRNI